MPPFLDLATIDRAIRCSEPRHYRVIYRAGETKQTFAVALAYELLSRWRKGEKIVTTRRKGWWQLAAILYGENIDLYRHLRTFRPEFSPLRPARDPK
jgi:hypothetical protein